MPASPCDSRSSVSTKCVRRSASSSMLTIASLYSAVEPLKMCCRGVALAAQTDGGLMNGSSLLILRGVISIVAGILAFAWPGITIAVLVVLFGIYAIIDGVSNLILGLTDTPSRG